MDKRVMREKIEMILLFIAGGIIVFGIVAMIINASAAYSNAAYAIFGGLVETCAYASIPAGLYAILVGQDMVMQHQGVPMPQPQPRPQQGFQQQGYPQQGGNFQQQGYQQQGGNFQQQGYQQQNGNYQQGPGNYQQ